MPVYRIINTDQGVRNIIVADQEYMDDNYFGNYELVEDIPSPLIPVSQLTKLEFQLRFTFEELVAIEVASDTNPAIRVLKNQQALAEYIDLSFPNTQLGIMYLVSIGLLTHDRGLEILSY